MTNKATQSAQTKKIKVTRDSGANVKSLKELENVGYIQISDVMLENGRENKKIKNKIYPSMVVGYARVGECVVGSNDNQYEELRRLIGKNNIKDVMHLEAHLRSGNDYFVTEDKDDILNKKEELFKKFGIKVVSPEELKKIVEKLFSKTQKTGIPAGWRRVKLGEVAEINPMERIEKNSIAKKIPMEALEPFQRKVSFFLEKEFKGGIKFRNGDTLVARITPSLENGKTAFVDILSEGEVGFGSTEFIVLRNKENNTDGKFIYYLARSSDFRELAIKSMTGTSGRQRVQTNEIINYQFFLPPLPEQKAIAEVLSGLDDKIDLLHSQNKTLEDMAQALFRKWFIDEADEGWEEKPLSYFGDIICGKTPSKKIHKYFDGKIPFIKIPDMHGNTFIFDTTDTLTKEGRDSQKNKILPVKSICVSCIATVGLVSMNAYESQINQQINSIIPKKDEYRYFLYLFMKSSNNLLHAMASGGTATLNLNTGNFAKILVPYPEESITREFHKKVESIFDKIFFNQSQIRTLENLRDTLLPKLMSGEVRVKF